MKWRFFTNGSDPFAERAYRQHILGRTGGVEGWKTSVDDYVTAARELLTHMRHGFDPAHPVVIGSNGNLREGAHRTACAIALGLMVPVRRSEKPGRARPWDAEWMRCKGMPAADIATAMQDLQGLTHGTDCGCSHTRPDGTPQVVGLRIR